MRDALVLFLLLLSTIDSVHRSSAFARWNLRTHIGMKSTQERNEDKMGLSPNLRSIVGFQFLPPLPLTWSTG